MAALTAIISSKPNRNPLTIAAKTNELPPSAIAMGGKSKTFSISVVGQWLLGPHEFEITSVREGAEQCRGDACAPQNEERLDGARRLQLCVYVSAVALAKEDSRNSR